MNATITNAAFELRGRIAFEHQRLNRTFLTRNGARMCFASFDGTRWLTSPDRQRMEPPRAVFEDGKWVKISVANPGTEA